MTNESGVDPDELVQAATDEAESAEDARRLAEVISETLLGDDWGLMQRQQGLNGFDRSASGDLTLSDLSDVVESNENDAVELYDTLRGFFEEKRFETPSVEALRTEQRPGDEIHPETDPVVEEADATKIDPAAEADHDHALDIEPESVDLIVTSPPYWQKRDYGVEGQLGQEESPQEYVDSIVDAVEQWQPFLRPNASVFLNVGDTHHRRSITGIPGMIVQRAREAGWTVRNEIVWKKRNGVPSAAKDRLATRHESILHLTAGDDYYYDLFGYSKLYGNGSNSGDVWEIAHDRNLGGHLAPYPKDLVHRIVTLACPPSVCPECGHARERIVERDPENLDRSRSQADRALEIYENSDTLGREHLEAIQKVGISDAGKAKEFQDGAGSNADSVQKLAAEAKEELGGYFREFTFPQPTTVGWTDCDCSVEAEPGLVFDPFAGSGTTLHAANELGYRAVGVDLDSTHFDRRK